MRNDLFTEKWHLELKPTPQLTHICLQILSSKPSQIFRWQEENVSFGFEGFVLHYCSAKAWAILLNKQKPTNELRKHQELVNAPDSLFNVQDIWEREEARAFVFIKGNDNPFLQESNGL